MNTPTKPFNRVVIAGGGTAGWMMAALMSKLLGKQLDIKLVESEEIGTVGVGEATIPALHTFHNLLGINEAEFMAATNATFKLGINFEAGGHRPGLLPLFRLDRQRPLERRLPTLLAQGPRRRPGQDLHRLQPRDGRRLRQPFCPRAAQRPELRLHLDAGRYAKFLRVMSEANGVQRIEGKIAAVLQDGPQGQAATSPRCRCRTAPASTATSSSTAPAFAPCCWGRPWAWATKTGRTGCPATAPWPCRRRPCARPGPTPAPSRTPSAAVAHPAATPCGQRPRLQQQGTLRRRRA